MQVHEAGPDLAAMKAKQQAAWSTGDYAVVGSTIVLTAELLSEAMDLHSGWRVLDVAAGNGNSTLAAARRGCEVTSTDYVPALLERGRARVDAEGWRVEFQVADAENLPFEVGSFDAVVSTFGVMFAPDQAKAARELARVCRVGGKIGLTCWTPDGFAGQMFRTNSRHVPPPAGMRAAVEWGTEARLRELFPEVAELRVERRVFRMRARSTEAWLAGFRKFFGPMQKTFAALDEAGQAALASDLLALADGRNEAKDGTMVVPSEYLEIVIMR